MPPESADILIVGGGPTGAALSLALRSSGLNVVLLEAKEFITNDPRPLALSYGSRLILERLGVWAKVAEPTPILSIHVSQRGGFGRSLLSSKEAGVPALGYVVSHSQLQSALRSALTNSFGGATVLRVEADDKMARAEFSYRGNTQQIIAKLLVVAEGGRGLEGVEGMTQREKDYSQSAVVTQVRTHAPHYNVAYERFTPQGPLALLPFGEKLALVWTTAPQVAEMLCGLSDALFLQRLHQHFGDRLGKFTETANRASFPLKLKYAITPATQRLVFLGNAAQTLHPVAGQGFNLGLRDSWELSEIIMRNTSQLGTQEMLRAYRTRRRLDRYGGIFFTDTLLTLFTNNILPLRVARGLALAALDTMPGAKRFLMRRMIFGARG
jgi:2-octaprenyl-6-methoxyphenol hydroxylase